jgi:hypothetical protein
MLFVGEGKMSYLQRLWAQVGPTLEAIESGSPIGADTLERPEVSGAEGSHEGGSSTTVKTPKLEAGSQPPIRPGAERSVVVKWRLNDLLFIAMLLLALSGVILRLPVTY